jgi:hypothetical protein
VAFFGSGDCSLLLYRMLTCQFTGRLPSGVSKLGSEGRGTLRAVRGPGMNVETMYTAVRKLKMLVVCDEKTVQGS